MALLSPPTIIIVHSARSDSTHLNQATFSRDPVSTLPFTEITSK